MHDQGVKTKEIIEYCYVVHLVLDKAIILLEILENSSQVLNLSPHEKFNNQVFTNVFSFLSIISRKRDLYFRHSRALLRRKRGLISFHTSPRCYHFKDQSHLVAISCVSFMHQFEFLHP
jgi:hypothetical protein